MSLSPLFSTHHFELSPQEEALFSRLLELFLEYNSHTNLSAIRDPEAIIEKHFIDSLYGAPVIGEILSEQVSESPIRLLDIGSGGGFPGIPLRIVIPELEITLLDSVGKKVRAMQHFIDSLGLSDIEAIQDRAEKLALNPKYARKYDIVVSRATAYITDILTWAEPFLREDGRIILYKMPSSEESRDRAKILKKLRLQLRAELPYTLGGTDRVIQIYDRVR